MQNDVLVWIAWSFIFALAFLSWFYRLTNNHYERGFRDGFHRARSMERQGDSQ